MSRRCGTSIRRRSRRGPARASRSEVCATAEPKSAALFVGPDPEFIAGGVGEVETPAAGKGEDRLHDLAAGLLDARLCFLELARVENHEWRAFGRRFLTRDSAIDIRMRERGVVRTPVLERPAERVAVEFLGGCDRAHVQLDVVDAVVEAMPFVGH